MGDSPGERSNQDVSGGGSGMTLFRHPSFVARLWLERKEDKVCEFSVFREEEERMTEGLFLLQ